MIYLSDGDNAGKLVLIPDETTSRDVCSQRGAFGLLLEDESMFYQLVGGVMAYQGEDG